MSEAPSSPEDALGQAPSRERMELEEELPFDIPLQLFPDGAFVLDEQWRIIALNPVAVRLLGHSREELLGRCCGRSSPRCSTPPSARPTCAPGRRG
ncbi:PAS domain-containing protein [Cystobacter fuscus]